MNSAVATNESEYDLCRLREYGTEELSTLFESCSLRLRNMIRYRLHPELRSRVDEADILQDAYLEAARRLPEYLAEPRVSPHIWIRKLVRQTIWQTHRFHIDAAKRTIEAESPKLISHNTSADSMAIELCDSATSPSLRAARAELQANFKQNLENMDPFEREVLCLKQLEQLSFSEIAEELETDASRAKRAFYRAAMQMRQLLRDHQSGC